MGPNVAVMKQPGLETSSAEMKMLRWMDGYTLEDKK